MKFIVYTCFDAQAISDRSRMVALVHHNLTTTMLLNSRNATQNEFGCHPCMNESCGFFSLFRSNHLVVGKLALNKLMMIKIKNYVDQCNRARNGRVICIDR